MPEALNISERFARNVLVPLLRQRHGDLADRIAIGVHGTGSDVLGLDDTISRDHHWGPRAAVLLSNGDAHLVESVRQTLEAACPTEFEGHPVRHDAVNRTAVCVGAAGNRAMAASSAARPAENGHFCQRNPELLRSFTTNRCNSGDILQI